ncbi:MAG: hypothetical protein WB995_06785 [Candidatus Acidiferrales bacterium]
MNRKTLLSIFVVVLVASFVSACSSGHKAPPPITVQLAPAPPGALEVSLSVQIGAQVTSDTAGAGVDWTLACTSADCGSIAPAHTASGGATTYTAPSVVPTGGTVTITATSTTDTTQSASADVTINPLGSNSGLAQNNQYAFFVTGIDNTGTFYAEAGSFTSNGDGTLIDGGEADFVDGVCISEADTLTGGTYNIGPDGRGTISWTANFEGSPDDCIGVALDGLQTFNIVTTSDFVNTGSHLLIAEAEGFATSSGVIDLQNAGDFTAGPAGSYVFTLTGQDTFSLDPATFGGVAITDGAGNITGVLDANDGGVQTSGADLTGATYTTPDANGRGTITFNNAAQQTATYYMVNAGVLRIVETDDQIFDFGAGGSAYTAASASGFDTTALTGNFVFLDAGQEAALGTVGIGGQVVLDGAGNITTGIDDASEGGALTSATAVAGTYSVPDPAMPRVVFDITSGNSGAIENVFAYLADPAVNFFDPNNTAAAASGALLMDSDVTANGTGFLVEQAPAAASTFAGNYAFDFQLNALENELDITGQGFSDGTSTITGNGDFNFVGGTSVTEPLAGTFAADPDNPGRITAAYVFDPTGELDVVMYQITSSQLVVVGALPGNITVGTVISQ